MKFIKFEKDTIGVDNITLVRKHETWDTTGVFDIKEYIKSFDIYIWFQGIDNPFEYEYETKTERDKEYKKLLKKINCVEL